MVTIKIETEKVVTDDGIKMRTIVGLSGCLDRSQLPELYVMEKDCIWADEHHIHIQGEAPNLRIGSTISEGGFQKSLLAIQKAGRLLVEKKAELKKLRAEWNGKETVFV